MYKKCVNCKKTLPEYLVGDYPLVFKSPVCPMCALTIINKIKRRPPGTPFDKETDQEGLYEAQEFLIVQSKRNFGGHMINPPEDCKWAFKQSDGGFWTDLGNCNRSCKDRCIRSYQWKRMTEDERQAELFENGIINA